MSPLTNQDAWSHWSLSLEKSLKGHLIQTSHVIGGDTESSEGRNNLSNPGSQKIQQKRKAFLITNFVAGWETNRNISFTLGHWSFTSLYKILNIIQLVLSQSGEGRGWEGTKQLNLQQHIPNLEKGKKLLKNTSKAKRWFEYLNVWFLVLLHCEHKHFWIILVFTLSSSRQWIFNLMQEMNTMLGQPSLAWYKSRGSSLSLGLSSIVSHNWEALPVT